MRYFPESQSDPAIISKCLAADILLMISNLETDAKATVFLQKLKQDIDDQKSRPNAAPVSQKEDLHLFEVIAMAKGYEQNNEESYVCMLFDLLLYRH